jgi:DNA-binding response OmpR family regulator
MAPKTNASIVLVVDDTDANRYVVVRHLTRSGYEVMEAANGRDALRLATTALPDLVVLDVRLPDINGFEIARQLREDPRTAGIPILHISASFTDPETKARGLDNGADGYLTHPIEPEVVLSTVNALLRARNAEREVRRAAVQWQVTFDAIGEGVCITDSKGVVIRCNRAFNELMGKVQEDGQSLLEQVPELHDVALLPGGGDQPRTARIKVGDRTLRVSLVVTGLDPDAAGRQVYVVTDLTRELKADERVRRIMQLETTGRLAGGVAHEINNMMTAILAYAEFALRGLDVDDRRREDIEGIHKAATRSAEIARKLLTYSRRQVVQPKQLDLHRAIREIEPTLRRILGSDRTLTLDLKAPQHWVMIDPLGFEQIMINLALNARDATGPGGRVTITSGNVTLDEGVAVQYPDIAIQQGKYVQLTVSDTGHGMSENTMERVFDPFFTTKEVGQGTGLGLAMVFGMVKQSNGYVWATSEEGQGSTFTIQLPQVTRSSGETSSPVEKNGKASGRLLVVEDEAVVLHLLGRGLRENGYEVEEAMDAAQAIAILERIDGKVDAVITDVVMPAMSGKDLAKQIRSRWPGLPILFISGYTSDEVVGKGLIDQGEKFLQKPFAPDVLARAVGEMVKP